MRINPLLFGAAMLVGLAACGDDVREQEDVTVPGEGPTYQTEPATAAPAPIVDDTLMMDTTLMRDTTPPIDNPLTPPPTTY